MEFSFSGVSVAQGQTGFCDPLPRVSSLPVVCGRACALNCPRVHVPRTPHLFFIIWLSFFLSSGARPPFFFMGLAVAFAGAMASPLIFAHLAR